MFNCGWCGAEVPPGLEYCPNCGHQYTATQTCPRCQTQVPINIRLCSNCGAFLETASVDATASGIRMPQAQMQQPAMQATTPGYYTQPAAGVVGARKKKEVWMKGMPLDIWYIIAASFAVASGMFYWVPRLGIILSVIGLVIAAVGYFRFWRMPGEHSGLWLNIAATVILIVAMIFSIKFGSKVEHAAIHGLLYSLWYC